MKWCSISLAVSCPEGSLDKGTDWRSLLIWSMIVRMTSDSGNTVQGDMWPWAVRYGQRLQQSYRGPVGSASCKWGKHGWTSGHSPVRWDIGSIGASQLHGFCLLHRWFERGGGSHSSNPSTHHALFDPVQSVHPEWRECSGTTVLPWYKLPICGGFHWLWLALVQNSMK